MKKHECPACHGEGELNWNGETNRCHVCGGEGKLAQPPRRRATMLKEVGRAGTCKALDYWGHCTNCGMVIQGPSHEWTRKVDRTEGRVWHETSCIQEGCGATVEGHSGDVPAEMLEDNDNVETEDYYG